ncbi:MAG TPA: DUF4270 family protein [Cytophagaceae bacterium]|jgi:hypothetical protein
MNLSVKYSGLLLTSALFFLSCKKEVNKISLNEKPQLGVFFNDSLEIEAEVVKMDDALQSSSDKDLGNSAMLVGNYNDPKFGAVNAESYTALIRKSTNNLKDASIISGSITVLKTYTYGSVVVKNQSFPIYEITGDFEKAKYFTKDINRVSSKEPVIGVLVADAADASLSTFKAALDKDFCERLLFDTISKEFRNRLVKGIHIKPGSDGIGVNRFEANNDKTYINIKYRKGNDTMDYRFGLGSDSTKFYTITTNFAGSKIEKIGTEAVPTSLLEDKAYVQAGTGLMMKIRIKGLKEFANKIGPNAIINGAELVMEIDTVGEKNFAKPSLNLLYKKNGDYFKYGFVNFLQENVNGNTPVAVVPSGNVYQFVLTKYLKSIIKGAEPIEDLLVFPFENTNTFTLNRVVFNTNTAQSKPLKLNIYYTK